jgi:hypothetical protein
MADGTVLNAGVGGDKIWTEDYGGSGKLQRVKIAIGAVDTDNGNVSSSNGLPVRIDQTTVGTTDSVTVATGQGAGATIGTTTDTAVVGDNNGTISAKLRGIDKILNSAWDSTNGLLHTATGGANVVALNAVTANGSSSVISYGSPRRNLSMQTILTGSPTGGTVTLYGSLDGTNFDTTSTGLAQFTIGTDASGAIKFVVDKPVMAVKVTLASLAGGTAPTITANVIAM